MASDTPPPPGDDDPAARPAGGLFDNDLANTVKNSAQQIWLAGLGAFAKAQEEGTKVFEALVREGTSMQRRTQPAPGDRPEPAPSRAAGGGPAGPAAQPWDRLESIFEERVAKALNRLGVPSVKDVAALEARLDRLAAEVARLSGAPASEPPTAAGDDDRAGEPGTEAR